MPTISAIKVQLPNNEFRRFPFKPEHVRLSALCALCALRSALCALRSALCALRSAIASLSED